MSAATVNDLKAAQQVDIFGLTKDYADEAPLLQHIEIMRVAGVDFKPPYASSSLPPAYRAAYSGKDYADAGLASTTVELKYVDFSVYADVQIAEAYQGGAEAYLAVQQDRAIAGAMREIQQQFLLGVAHNNTSGSYGYDDFFPCSSGTYSVTGPETTGSTCTEVFALNTNECRLLVGRSGELSLGEVRKTTVNDTNGKPFEAYCVAGGAWVGAAFLGTHAGRRLVNIQAKDVTDAYCASLIEAFGDGFKPNLFAMNGGAIAGLRRSRTATNPTGAPAPFPEEVYGRRIVEVAIPNNIAAISVT